MVPSFIKVLAQSQHANQFALDKAGRYDAPILGVVTKNDDPDDKRRVKISDPAVPALETNWLRAIRPYPQIDPPIPEVGATVIVWFIDGDPANGYYLPITNDTNPPAEKDSATDDFHENVPGDRKSETGGDRLDRVSEIYTVKVGKSFRLENDSGAYISLTEAGLVVIADRWGHKITLGAGSSNDILEWDLGGAEIRIKNAGDFTVTTGSGAGQRVATIDAIDTRGDHIVSSGWL